MSVALGGLFGYKADRLLVQGDTFADTPSALDEFHPGRVTAADLGPFTITLNKFNASYITSGPQRGQPSAFDAQISYTASRADPGRPPGGQPPAVGRRGQGYLIGHGYAPEFKVTDARGQVVYQRRRPSSPDVRDFLSEGVSRSRRPAEQLGFRRLPATAPTQRRARVGVPRRRQPGGEPDRLRGEPGPEHRADAVGLPAGHPGMHQLTANPQVLLPGQSLKLPDGQGTITFTGYVPWVSLAITHDPGQLPALICGIAALGGLLLSFMVRRRRVFVRARPAARHHGAGRRPGPHRRQRRLRGRVRPLAAELRSAHEQAGAHQGRSTVNKRESEAVPVNLALGHVSNDFLIAALVLYSLSVVAFAGDFAFGRPRRAAAAARRRPGNGPPPWPPSARPARVAAPAPRECLGGSGPGLRRTGPRRRGRVPSARGRHRLHARAGFLPPHRCRPAAGSRRPWRSAIAGRRASAAVVTRGLAVHRAPGATCTSSSPP